LPTILESHRGFAPTAKFCRRYAEDPQNARHQNVKPMATTFKHWVIRAHRRHPWFLKKTRASGQIIFRSRIALRGRNKWLSSTFYFVGELIK
jgi:hypothetical protein